MDGDDGGPSFEGAVNEEEDAVADDSGDVGGGASCPRDHRLAVVLVGCAGPLSSPKDVANAPVVVDGGPQTKDPSLCDGRPGRPSGCHPRTGWDRRRPDTGAAA